MARTLHRLTLLALMAVTAAGPGASSAPDRVPGGPPPPVAPFTNDPLPDEPVVVPMVFPVVGEVRWRDSSYGEPRAGFRHTGVDICAPKMRPILAPISGVLGFKQFSFWIVGEGRLEGWRVLGTHLNDDTPGTNDGKNDPDFMFAPDLRPGDRVVAGQLIGYVGNSGDATGPHLHLELHGRDGIRSPAPSLRRARHLDVPAAVVAHPEETPAPGEVRLDGCPRGFDPATGVLTLQVVARQAADEEMAVTATPTRCRVVLPSAMVRRLGGPEAVGYLPEDRVLRIYVTKDAVVRVARLFRDDERSPVAARTAEPAARRVSYEKVEVNGITAHVVSADLNDPAVSVDLAVAEGLPDGDEPLSDLLRKSRPVAAVNGACFDKQTLHPIGDLVRDGQVLHSGRMGTVLAIDGRGRALIRRVPWGRTQDWDGYRTVLGCGPTLVRAGEIDLRPADERFRDPHLLGRSTRSAAGLTAANRLLLVTIPQPVTLDELAAAMLRLGCEQAMNLDGGASTALYYRGRTVVPPGRRLTNLLVIREERGPAPLKAAVLGSR